MNLGLGLNVGSVRDGDRSLGLEESLGPLGLGGRRLRLEKLLLVMVGGWSLSQDSGGLVSVLGGLSQRNESNKLHRRILKNLL